MATWSRRILSGSSNGIPIAISDTSTATTVTTIHTGATATAIIDHVYLWAANIGSIDRTITFDWGATGIGGRIQVSIPFQDGAYKVADGWPVQGVPITCYGTATDTVVKVFGYVNRAT